MSESVYTNWRAMSDRALLEQIGSFVKQHRVEQNKSQDELARDAGVSRSTLSLLERGETVTLATLIQILRALQLLQVLDAFVFQPTISPLLVAEAQLKMRKRGGYVRKKITLKNQTKRTKKK
jgi:transcriptional regulator with XRE-family HTH domain